MSTRFRAGVAPAPGAEWGGELRLGVPGRAFGKGEGMPLQAGLVEPAQDEAREPALVVENGRGKWVADSAVRRRW